jgi:hypothetical protein
MVHGGRRPAGHPGIPGRFSVRMTDPVPKIAVSEPTGIGAPDFFLGRQNLVDPGA